MSHTKGIGGHQSARALKDEWLTPPWVLQACGEFDLDPCAPIHPPWRMAKKHYTIEDDGLVQPWEGRVWCNPPYGAVSKHWLKLLKEHGNGIACIFARTETKAFFEHIWEDADALLFIKGRLHFHHVDGARAKSNGGAPTVLVAYGENNVQALKNSGIDGKFVRIN